MPLLLAAKPVWDLLFLPLANDSDTQGDGFFITEELRILLLMALHDVDKVQGRTNPRGKKMPALDFPLGQVAAVIAELCDRLFRFTVASPTDPTPRKQRLIHEQHAVEAIANKHRLVYLNKARLRSASSEGPLEQFDDPFVIAETEGNRNGPYGERLRIPVARCIAQFGALPVSAPSSGSAAPLSPASLITRGLLHAGGVDLWFKRQHVLGQDARVLHRLLVGEKPSKKKQGPAPCPGTTCTVAAHDSDLVAMCTDGMSLTFDMRQFCEAHIAKHARLDDQG
jgi:hypothetical protein